MRAQQPPSVIDVALGMYPHGGTSELGGRTLVRADRCQPDEADVAIALVIDNSEGGAGDPEDAMRFREERLWAGRLRRSRKLRRERPLVVSDRPSPVRPHKPLI